MTRERIVCPPLVLRPLEERDAEDIERYASDKRIALMTGSIPHPYPTGEGLKFIKKVTAEMTEGGASVFAITHQADDALIGAIGLHDLLTEPELGYWLRVDDWGKGFMSLTVRAMVDYFFNNTEHQVLMASVLDGNEGSKHVLIKAGFKSNGIKKGACGLRGSNLMIEYFKLTRGTWLNSR